MIIDGKIIKKRINYCLLWILTQKFLPISSRMDLKTSRIELKTPRVKSENGFKITPRTFLTRFSTFLNPFLTSSAHYNLSHKSDVRFTMNHLMCTSDECANRMQHIYVDKLFKSVSSSSCTISIYCYLFVNLNSNKWSNSFFIYLQAICLLLFKCSKLFSR